ncbi:unnamed protein product [Calicophoron daubneyi]|uniref:Uncharacterized protein n=1 Tax=Calicophoron daubneyi TaxID=300641 RepID=A0AAV2T8Y9_CALDB
MIDGDIEALLRNKVRRKPAETCDPETSVHAVHKLKKTRRKSRSQLYFEAGLSAVHRGRPLVRLAALSSSRGSKFTEVAGENLFKKIAESLSDRVHMSILTGLSAIEAIQQVCDKMNSLPPQIVSSKPTYFSMEHLYKLLRKNNSVRLGPTNEPVSTGLPAWLSYTCDGTLTIRYPSGSPALIWTPAPVHYCHSSSNQIADQVSSVVAPVSNVVHAKTGKRVAPPSATRRQSIARSNLSVEKRSTLWPASDCALQQTGFYLILLDIPLLDSGRSDRFAEGKHGGQERKESYGLVDSGTPSSGSSGPGLDTLGLSRPSQSGTSSRRQSSMSNVSHPDERRLLGPTQNCCVNSPQSVHGVDEAKVGQLLAHFTPDGEGSVFYRAEANGGRQKTEGSDVLAVITSDNCYRFGMDGRVSHRSVWPPHKRMADPTNRLPFDLDVQLNEYLRVRCSGPNDLVVVYHLESDVELHIQCNQTKRRTQLSKTNQVPEDAKKRGDDENRLLTKLPFLSSLADHNQGRSQSGVRKRRLFARSRSMSPRRNKLGLSMGPRHQSFDAERITVENTPRSGILKTSKGRSGRENLKAKIAEICQNEVEFLDSCPSGDQLPMRHEELEAKEGEEFTLSPRRERSTIMFTGPSKEHVADKLTVSRGQSEEPTFSALPPSPNPDRIRGLPADCPVLLRAWLNEVQTGRFHRSQTRLLLTPKRSISVDSYVPVGPNADLINRLSRVDFSSLRIAAKGCRCKRVEVPELTDTELDLFLQNVVPPDQAIIITVYDSRNPKSMETEMFTLTRELYMAQHRTSPVVTYEARSLTFDEVRKQSYGTHKSPDTGTRLAIGGMGACAAISTRLAQYRFLNYDLAQNAENLSEEGSSCSVLRQRHGGRPRVGDCLIFLRGCLCFVGSSLLGHVDRAPNKKLLEQQIIQCREKLKSSGFFVPSDFQMP